MAYRTAYIVLAICIALWAAAFFADFRPAYVVFGVLSGMIAVGITIAEKRDAARDRAEIQRLRKEGE